MIFSRAAKAFRTLHNRRPILWTVVAFVTVVILTTVLSVWWNVLLVQNHRILESISQAAAAAAVDPKRATWPLASLMVVGILCSAVLLLGMVYLFLRLIKTVQLNIAQNQFIASVTHELRSPVASLQILLETIRDPSTPTLKRQEFEGYMALELTRLRSLVDQVLETTRLESILSASTMKEEVNIAKLLEACAQTVEARLKASSGKLQIEHIDSGLTIRANKSLLTTALANLLDNAIKYSPLQADIRVQAELKNSKWIELSVQDHGIGLERREQKQIFKRFYRAGNPLTHERPGTGLGLYFARLAVRAQGGKLSVTSPGPGQGSTFKIELPL